jgi:hypothetical protein
MKILISITSVPQRFDNSLIEVLNSLKNIPNDKICPIPIYYKKWGAAHLPQSLKIRNDIKIFRPTIDYGPATKLLGAIEYLQQDHNYTHVLTLDDDVYYRNPDQLICRMQAEAIRYPNSVLTIGGIRLIRHPYSRKAGLKYHNKGHVDLVCGCTGTLYPVSAFSDPKPFFDLRHRLPEGIFNDDDLYFGIVLSIKKYPVISIDAIDRIIENCKRPMISTSSSNDSAVQSGTAKNRQTNESELIQFAVKNSLLPNPYTRVSLFQKAVSYYEEIARGIGIFALIGVVRLIAKRILLLGRRLLATH